MIWIPRCEKQVAWEEHLGIDQHQKKSHVWQKSGKKAQVDRRQRLQPLNNLLPDRRVELTEHTHTLDDDLITIRAGEMMDKSDPPDKAIRHDEAAYMTWDAIDLYIRHNYLEK